MPQYYRLKIWLKRNGLKWLPRAFAGVALLCLVWWAAHGGSDLGERAGLLQGVVALILLWVTWASIDRADRQIEITQQQTSALLSGERDHLLYVFVEDNDIVKAINLSKYPLIIQYAWLPDQYFADVPTRPLNLILHAGTSTALLSLRESLAYKTFIGNNPEEDSTVVEDGPTVLEIRYIYSGTGSIVYTKIYEVGTKLNYGNLTDSVEPWEPDLWLRDFKYEVKGLQDSIIYPIPIRNESSIPLPDDFAAQSNAEYTNRDIRFKRNQ